MKNTIADLLGILGMAAIAAGVAMLNVPAGIITAGGFALALGWCISRADNQDKDGDKHDL